MAGVKRKIAVADAETDPFEYLSPVNPFVFGYYDGDIYEDFWGDNCVEQFVDFIRDKYVFLYFHNGGKFDFYFLLPFIESKLSMIKQRIAECEIGDAKLRDSYLILPLPLAAYKKDQFDYNKMKVENRERHKEEIRQYLYHDCIYLHDWITKFVERFGVNLTLPSAAMKQLRATDYEVANVSEDYDTKFRPFYFGGRTQAFQTGRRDGPIQYVDINSAYPYAMLHRHPRGNSYMTLDKLPSVNAPYFAIIDAVSCGALPVRNEDGGIDFPDDRDGTMRTYQATGWEIQAGLDTGTLRIVRVHKSFLFTDCSRFTEFVNKFYGEKLQAKKDGDKDTETFSKLILNSCYGKFGQNPREFNETQVTEMGQVPDEVNEDYRKLLGAGFQWFHDDEGNRVYPDNIIVDGKPDLDLMIDRGWSRVNSTETDHSIWEKEAPGDRYFNVVTAASITGFVRAYLWRAICQCEDVLYCDTDSIMARRFAGKIGDDLGDWSIEADLKHVWIGGKKLYAACTYEDEYKKIGDAINPWKVASKGVRLEPLQIQRIVENGETIRWQNMAPSFSLTMGTRWIERNIGMRG